MDWIIFDQLLWYRFRVKTIVIKNCVPLLFYWLQISALMHDYLWSNFTEYYYQNGISCWSRNSSKNLYGSIFFDFPPKFHADPATSVDICWPLQIYNRVLKQEENNQPFSAKEHNTISTEFGKFRFQHHCCKTILVGISGLDVKQYLFKAQKRNFILPVS